MLGEISRSERQPVGTDETVAGFMNGVPIPDFYNSTDKKNPLANESMAPVGPIYVFGDGRLVKDRTYKKDGETVTVLLNDVDRDKISSQLSEKGYELDNDGKICDSTSGRPVSLEKARKILILLSF